MRYLKSMISAFINGALSVSDPELLWLPDGYPKLRVRGFQADRKKLAADCNKVWREYARAAAPKSSPQL